MISGRFLSVLSCLVLCACLGGGDVARLGTAPFWFRASAPASWTVPDSAIVLRGPRGYCIDPESRQSGGEVHFARLGSCASLANSRLAGVPDNLAILTASVSGPGSGGISGMGDAAVSYFQSEPGRAKLARSGNSEDLSVGTIGWDSGALIISATDRSAASGLNETNWRGFLDVQDRVVTITVSGVSGRRLSESAGRALLHDFILAIRQANGISVPEMTPST